MLIVVALIVVKQFVFWVIARYPTMRFWRKLEEMLPQASRTFLNQNFRNQTAGRPSFSMFLKTNTKAGKSSKIRNWDVSSCQHTDFWHEESDFQVKTEQIWRPEVNILDFKLSTIFENVEKQTTKISFRGFLQSDLDQNLSEWSSSDSLAFYQVLPRKIHGKFMKIVRIKFRNKSRKHWIPCFSLVFLYLLFRSPGYTPFKGPFKGPPGVQIAPFERRTTRWTMVHNLATG